MLAVCGVAGWATSPRLTQMQPCGLGACPDEAPCVPSFSPKSWKDGARGLGEWWSAKDFTQAKLAWVGQSQNGRLGHRPPAYNVIVNLSNVRPPTEVSTVNDLQSLLGHVHFFRERYTGSPFLKTATGRPIVRFFAEVFFAPVDFFGGILISPSLVFYSGSEYRLRLEKRATSSCARCRSCWSLVSIT
jgi:hypothetical protein